MSENPKRRVVLELNLQADDIPTACRGLLSIVRDIEEGSLECISGGYDLGWRYQITVNPEQTHHGYIADLNAYLQKIAPEE